MQPHPFDEPLIYIGNEINTGNQFFFIQQTKIVNCCPPPEIIYDIGIKLKEPMQFVCFECNRQLKPSKILWIQHQDLTPALSQKQILDLEYTLHQNNIVKTK